MVKLVLCGMDYANRLAAEKNLPVIELKYQKGILSENKQSIVEIGAGPAEFLGYIHYADYVLTNSFHAIEGFNRQLRKVTKSKTVFPSDDSLLKMLYLAMMDITKKWTGHRQDWGQIYSQLEIFFEERLSGL